MQIMLATHVNLCDLLDSTGREGGGRVRVFGSVKELREYTLNTRKIFPKEEAYAGGLLKFLLREITGEYHGHYGQGRRKRAVRRRH